MKILDTSVVILFLNDIDGKQYFALLSKNNHYLHIPVSVYDEILDNSQIHEVDSLISQNIISKMVANDPSEEIALKSRFPGLGNGEINVLCCGLKLKNSHSQFFCVIDEKLGRSAAQKLELPLTGSIGLLKILKDNKLLNIEQLKSIVEDIKKSPFRVNEVVLRNLTDEQAH
jgi:predicted nucleic acid-binding protein